MPTYDPNVGNVPPYVHERSHWQPGKAEEIPRPSKAPQQRRPDNMRTSLPPGSLTAQARNEAHATMNIEQFFTPPQSPPNHHQQFAKFGAPPVPAPTHAIATSAPPADRGIQPFVGHVRYEQCRQPEYMAVPLQHRPTPYAGIAEINETNHQRLAAEFEKQKRYRQSQQHNGRFDQGWNPPEMSQALGQPYADHRGSVNPEFDNEGNLTSGSWVCVGSRPSLPPTVENLPAPYTGWGGQPGSTPYPSQQHSVATIARTETAPPTQHSVATAVPANYEPEPMCCDIEIEVDDVGVNTTPIVSRNAESQTKSAAMRATSMQTEAFRDPDQLLPHDDNTCSICLDEYGHGHQCLRLECGHIYHEMCWQNGAATFEADQMARDAYVRQVIQGIPVPHGEIPGIGPWRGSCPICRSQARIKTRWTWIDRRLLTQPDGEGQISPDHVAPNRDFYVMPRFADQRISAIYGDMIATSIQKGFKRAKDIEDAACERALQEGLFHRNPVPAAPETNYQEGGGSASGIAPATAAQEQRDLRVREGLLEQLIAALPRLNLGGNAPSIRHPLLMMLVAVAWLKPHHREAHLSGDRVLASRPSLMDSSSTIENNHSKNDVGSTTKQTLW